MGVLINIVTTSVYTLILGANIFSRFHATITRAWGESISSRFQHTFCWKVIFYLVS